jgi:hypothetical protein
MTRTTVAAVAIAAIVFGTSGRQPLAAADRPGLAGRWTLNRDLSQLTREVGFGMDLVSARGAGADSGGGGRSGGGGTGLGDLASFRESESEAKRREQLVDEAANPSPHLTIVQTEAAITMTDERGRKRTFHPHGREESQALDQVAVATTTRWDGARLEITYKVEQGREMRYLYSRTLDPPQLIVQVQFLERGSRDSVTRVYEPTKANEAAVPARTAPPDLPRPIAAAPTGAVPASELGRPAAPTAPAGAPPPVVPKGPDAELKGLTELGLVVEDLSAQAAACGLSQAPIEAAAAKSLSDAGLKVRRNSDEDTYVYVHVITTSVSPGLCVSRYDVFLYSHTTTTLPYQASPVLVQVSLLRNGGLAGGAPGAHADLVVRNVKQYVDAFATRIRNANQ